MKKGLQLFILITLISFSACGDDDVTDQASVTQIQEWLTDKPTQWVDYDNKHQIEEGTSNWYEGFAFEPNGVVKYIQKSGNSYNVLDSGTYQILEDSKIKISLSESSYWKSGTYRFNMNKSEYFHLGGRKFKKEA